MLTRTLLATCIISALWLSIADAKNYYRWIDENGNPVYSETPPEAGIKADSVPLAATPPPTPAPSQRTTAKAVKGDGSPAEKKRKAEVREMMEKNCAAARHNLSVYKNPQPTLIKMPDGSFDRLTDEMRAEKSKKAEKQIEDFCIEPTK